MKENILDKTLNNEKISWEDIRRILSKVLNNYEYEDKQSDEEKIDTNNILLFVNNKGKSIPVFGGFRVGDGFFFDTRYGLISIKNRRKFSYVSQEKYTSVFGPDEDVEKLMNDYYSYKKKDGKQHLFRLSKLIGIKRITKSDLEKINKLIITSLKEVFSEVKTIENNEEIEYHYK